MIRLQGVTFTYPGSGRPAIRQVSLEIPTGTLTLVTGVSGAGKSTLLRCINGLVPHFSGGELSGLIRVNELDPVKCSPKLMSRHVGFVFQDPETQFVLDRVEDDIAFSLENAALPPDEMQARVDQAIRQLGLGALRERKIETLSGGERQRAAIAAALVLGPSILILDEPTSQLDPGSAEEVLQTVVRLKQELDLTVLISEHRLERVLPYAERLIYLDGTTGQAIEGPPRQVLPRMAFTSPLISLGKALGWRPLPLSIHEAQRFASGMQAERAIDARMQAPKSGETGAKPGAVSPEASIQARDVSVVLGGKPVLRGLSLEARQGEILALIGPNGAGKTTLLRTLVGLQKPAGGGVSICGVDIAGLEVAEICRRVGYLPQDPNSLLFADRVGDELAITLRNHAMPVDPAWIEALLERFGLGQQAEAYPRDLSVGQRQRAALCAILVTRPQVLMLDEPTRGLDPQAKRDLLRFLQEWRAEGKTVLLVTHDVELAAAAADRVAIMGVGEIIDQGATYPVLSRSQVFRPQMAQLFPGRGWLTVEDVLAGYPG
ncbi:MAG: energy-coupling factor ABC transporter ATP-binding protein [Anaerolineales bacterium]|nr:energy-coupling factor ABC transporter ATP-binding protein [Anaerolineales bacterium]